MKFAAVAVSSAMIATASAQYGYANTTSYAAPSYTTTVVTSYETYCPYATSLVVGGSTYTVTEATTLTITNCPCTLTYSTTASPTSTPAVYTSSPVVPPSSNVTYVVPTPYTSIPATTSASSPVAPPASYTTAPGNATQSYTPPAATNGASKMSISAALVGMVGVAAFML